MTSIKLKIAVTGGIGSGKSEFCKYLFEKGFPVINADAIAKDLLVTNKTIKEKIISAFGKKSYLNTQPDTKYLAKIVFSDPENVKKINNIIHPFVIKIQNSRMKELLKENDLVFLDAALIYEAEVENDFDYVVLITADDKNKIQRICRQRDLTEKEIRKRMVNQIPDEIKKEWADFVFENNGSLNELKLKAEFLINILKSFRGKN